MAAIIRQERKDYGGVEVWVAEDAHCPIYFADGIVDEARIDAVLAGRHKADKIQTVDGYFAEIGQDAIQKIEERRRLKAAELGDDYADMARKDVRAYVSVVVSSTTARL